MINIFNIKHKAGIIIVSILWTCCFIPPIKYFSDEFLIPKWYLSISATLIIIIYLCLANIFNRRIKINYIKISIVLSVYCAIESMYAIFIQLSKIRYDERGLSGSFDNPAGLACCLSAMLPLTWYAINVCHKIKLYRNLCIVCILIMCTTIFLTNSRTGIICIIIYIIVWSIRIILYNTKIWITTTIFTFIIGGIYICSIKQESTTGRIFILERTFDMIRKSPLKGYGYGGFRKYYMKEQEFYFKNNKNRKYMILASDVHHPLNEFLLLWVNYGIFGPIFLFIIFVVPLIISFHHKKGIFKVLSTCSITIFIFSIFSYPFKYPLSWLICLLCWTNILDKLVINKKNTTNKKIISISLLPLLFTTLGYTIYKANLNQKWETANNLSLKKEYQKSMLLYDKLYNKMHNNPHFLYNCAISRYSCGLFNKAKEATEACSKQIYNYNIELLSGDLCRMTNDFANAQKHYISARNMCPSRFAPLYGLFCVYTITGDTANAIKIANTIENKHIKIPSKDIFYIKSETTKWINNNIKHKNCKQYNLY